MQLTKTVLDAAPLCAGCADYADADAKIVWRELSDGGWGWVHVGNDSERCLGQGDDDTDDRARPLIRGTSRRLADAHYVVGFAEDGHDILGELVDPARGPYYFD